MASTQPLAPAPRPGAATNLRLCDLEPGGRGRIVAVDPAADLGGRLGDLGFLPGTVVTLVRRAPLGDPAVYALRGTRFCLRREQSAAVRVEPLEDDESAR